jgi:spermidine synthase
MRSRSLHALFFLSGTSALVYEIVWQRLVELVLGVSTLSISAVLAAFMGGLALGGLFFGRLADRSQRPLRLYAGLEAAIAVAGLAVPAALAIVRALYMQLYHVLAPGPWGSVTLRFGMAVLVLTVPATLIGGTLPVMGRVAIRRASALPAGFSLLYACNTLGAVLGAVLTGFFFLRLLGMQQTLIVAAGLNLLVAAAACWMAPSAPEPATTRMDSGHTGLTAGVLTMAATTGAASMVLEVVWARILGVLTSNSAYGFALLVTVVLTGLALGALLQTWWCSRPGDSWTRLAICQWLLALVCLLSPAGFHSAPLWFDHWCNGRSAAAVFLGELLLTAGALLAPAVLLGASLPMLVAGAGGQFDQLGASLGRLYAFNTLGCAAGAMLAGLLAIPWLGIQHTLDLIVLASILVGVAAWRRKPTASGKRLAGAVIIVGLGLVWIMLPSGPYLKSRVQAPRRLLYYAEGNNATVSVIEEFNGTRSILVDSQPVAGTVGTSRVDQKMLAHLPLLLHAAPKRALTVGFGSGGTSYSMCLHGIEVDCVEIEAAVARAAPLFRTENQDVERDRAFHLIADDARSWLRTAPGHYDVIVTDCTNIQYRSNGDLYTVDYFRLLRDRLAGGGVAAAWVPANGIAEPDLKTLLRSFRSIFPHMSIWFMNTLPTDFLIVVGTPAALDIDFDLLSRRMRQPEVARDLAAVGLDDPYRLLYTFLAGETAIDAYLGQGPLNSDDRPILSYSTYGANFRSTIAANLVQLVACRTDVAGFLHQSPPKSDLLRYYAASNELLLGHIAHFAGAEEAALRHYRTSRAILENISPLAFRR